MRLTQGRVVAQFQIIALKPLLGPPAVVSSFHDDVNLLVAVLTHISTEDPPPAVTGHRVSTVHGAAPHVSHPVGVHLRSGARVTDEWVIRWDPVPPPTGVTSIHINAQCFSQQSGSEQEKARLWRITSNS